MAKGQHLSSYQQGIVKRYYDHLDSAVLHKLQEAVGEIYLAAGEEKKLDKLWKSVAAALAKTPIEPAKVERVVVSRDVKLLAEFVAQLAPGGKHAKG